MASDASHLVQRFGVSLARRAGLRSCAAAVLLVATIAACVAPAPDTAATAARSGSAAGPGAAWTPGLGELMTAIQLRHGKLALAGAAHNWPLAGYELDELAEGFADVQALYPVHESLPLPTTTLIPNLTHEALDDLRAAVDAGDAQAFDAGLESLTSSCNACHTLAHHGFIVIRRAAVVPEDGQDFAPPPARPGPR